MISMGLQRDVPQYMAMPWLITWVMARTVSAADKTQVTLNRLHHSDAFPLVRPHRIVAGQCGARAQQAAYDKRCICFYHLQSK